MYADICSYTVQLPFTPLVFHLSDGKIRDFWIYTSGTPTKGAGCDSIYMCMCVNQWNKVGKCKRERRRFTYLETLPLLTNASHSCVYMQLACGVKARRKTA